MSFFVAALTAPALSRQPSSCWYATSSTSTSRTSPSQIARSNPRPPSHDADWVTSTFNRFGCASRKERSEKPREKEVVCIGRPSRCREGEGFPHRWGHSLRQSLFRVCPPLSGAASQGTHHQCSSVNSLVSLTEWPHRWGNLAPTQCPTLPVSEVDCTDGLTLVQP